MAPPPVIILGMEANLKIIKLINNHINASYQLHKRLMYIAPGNRVITVIYCTVDDITMR